jgi:MFS family permease
VTGSSLHDSRPAVAEDAARWQVLLFLCAAIVLSLTTWFSATAITPELQRAWGLSGAAVAWLTNGVQIGFVTGALLSSLVNLPDIVRLNRLMAISAILAALANVSLLLEPGIAMAIVARLVTGFALAGVYPPAMKLVATWFTRDRGLALGAVIAALTLGSALPHLFRAAAGTLDWTLVVGISSGSTVAGALMFWTLAREGPYPFAKAVFSPRQVGAILRNRALLLVNVGYLGHMWELYAMWAWLLAFTRSALEVQREGGLAAPSLVVFAAVAAGAVGCLIGGVVADRVGRALTAAGIMIVSATCAVLIGFVHDGPLWLFVVIAVVWGVFVVADSAQFSALVTELSDRRYVGTALSLQMGLGFALTVIVISLMPLIADALGGWKWTFLVLAPGPAIGAAAMLMLRRRMAATQPAG